MLVVLFAKKFHSLGAVKMTDLSHEHSERWM